MTSYELLPEWPDFPANLELGNPTGIGIDSNQNIFIFHRAGRTFTSLESVPESRISSKTILRVDNETGKILDSWGDGLFIMPHGLTVDMDNNIWTTDVCLHQVFKFNHEGRLLMKIGEAKAPGNDSTHFSFPTDVAVAKDGSFYVSDGYGNSRVVKFSPTGKYLFEWGEKGDKVGEFNLPHAIGLDDEENVYVADRENNRIQIFTPAGKFIRQWTDEKFGKISSVVFDKVRKVFIAVDYTTSLSGEVLGSEIILLGTSGNLALKFAKNEGLKCWYHNIIVDNLANIYVTDIKKNKVQKFKRV